jgi:hypothetical protein
MIDAASTWLKSRSGVGLFVVCVFGGVAVLVVIGLAMLLFVAAMGLFDPNWHM